MIDNFAAPRASDSLASLLMPRAPSPAHYSRREGPASAHFEGSLYDALVQGSSRAALARITHSRTAGAALVRAHLASDPSAGSTPGTPASARSDVERLYQAAELRSLKFGYGTGGALLDAMATADQARRDRARHDRPSGRSSLGDIFG